MYGYYGLGFDRALAQTQSIQLAEAGADAQSYKDTYSATVQKGKQAGDGWWCANVMKDVRSISEYWEFSWWQDVMYSSHPLSPVGMGKIDKMNKYYLK